MENEATVAMLWFHITNTGIAENVGASMIPDLARADKMILSMDNFAVRLRRFDKDDPSTAKWLDFETLAPLDPQPKRARNAPGITTRKAWAAWKRQRKPPRKRRVQL